MLFFFIKGEYFQLKKKHYFEGHPMLVFYFKIKGD